MYFSSDGQFDPTVDGLEAQLKGEVFKFTEEIPARTSVDTVLLTGTLMKAFRVFTLL